MARTTLGALVGVGVGNRLVKANGDLYNRRRAARLTAFGPLGFGLLAALMINPDMPLYPPLASPMALLCTVIGLGYGVYSARMFVVLAKTMPLYQQYCRWEPASGHAAPAVVPRQQRRYVSSPALTTTVTNLTRN